MVPGRSVPVLKGGLGQTAQDYFSAPCFENTSKEAAQAESIFDNNGVLQEEPTIFMA